MKFTIFILLGTLSSFLSFGQQIVKSTIHSTTNVKTKNVRQTVGQLFAPDTQSSFLYGFQAPVLIKVDVDVSLNISIYPNPIQEVLYIDIPKPDYSFTIHALNGKLISKGVLREKQNIISLHKMSKGVYVLRVYSSSAAIKAVANIIKE